MGQMTTTQEIEPVGTKEQTAPPAYVVYRTPVQETGLTATVTEG